MKKTPDTPSSTESGFVRNSHYILLTVIASFVLAALVLGEWLNMYDAVWWWDDMLHGLSGVILGLIGLLAIYFFNARHNMNLSPSFVAVFVFCFAVSMGVVWEVYEFTIDVFLEGTMQQWNMGPNAIVMGKPYQGMGLRDTMSDLIVACLGAFIAAIFSFVAFKHEKTAVLGVMRRVFGWRRRRS